MDWRVKWDLLLEGLALRGPLPLAQVQDSKSEVPEQDFAAIAPNG